MKENDILDDENFDITEHIIKKDGTGWEEKWNKPNDTCMRLYRMTEFCLKDIPVVKSNEPWYRRFENKKRRKR